MRVLFHTVNTVATATTLGDYDGGTGPSQPEREAKINLPCLRCWTTRLRLSQLRVWTGYGIANYVNIVEDGDSGWEPKRKAEASTSKEQVLHKSIGKRSKVKTCIWNKKHWVSECRATFYQVQVCTQSSCSCPDSNTYGMRSLCKHILFALLFALEMTDINILDKTEFQTQKVVNDRYSS